MTDKNILTPDGIKKLNQELSLRKEKRKEIIEKIELAREHGDLSENAEYHEARSEQSFNEGRILEIETILKNATLVKNSHGQGVQIGSKVKVKVNAEQKDFVIVGSNESNPSAGLISCDSPIGEALLNKEVGQTIEVQTPRGKAVYEIIAIK